MPFCCALASVWAAWVYTCPALQGIASHNRTGCTEQTAASLPVWHLTDTLHPQRFAMALTLAAWVYNCPATQSISQRCMVKTCAAAEVPPQTDRPFYSTMLATTTKKACNAWKAAPLPQWHVTDIEPACESYSPNACCNDVPLPCSTEELTAL